MSQKKKQSDLPLWMKTGHRKPVTRREFLASGVLPFTASLIAPSWMSLLLGSEARAEGAACANGVSGMIPFITVNLEGGAAMHANYFPMDQAGAPLNSYNLLGLGTGKNLTMEREFGVVPFAGQSGGKMVSQMLVGMRSKGGTALAKTAFVASCVRSVDDSGTNKLSADGMISRAGLIGSNLPNLGTNPTRTGTRNQSAVLIPPAPLTVRRVESVTNALSYAAAMGDRLNTNQKSGLARLIANLSQEQSKRIATTDVGQVVKQALDCAGVKNSELVGSTSNRFDPRQDPLLAPKMGTIWGVSGATAPTDQQYVLSTIVYNVLKGNAGSGSIELGGYDYHSGDNTGDRSESDAKDLEAGNFIGSILATAEALNTPVFIYVTTDGAISGPPSDDPVNSIFNTDRGTASLSYMLCFMPTGRPGTTGYQLGWFTNGQVVDESFITGNSPELASAAVVANYLQVNKKISLFEQVGPRDLVRSVDKVLKFT